MRMTLKISKALADQSRLRVVAVLMQHDELCVCQLTELLGLSTATVSRHMSILRGADLVQSRKKGRWVYYRLSGTFPGSLRGWLEESLLHSPEVAADRAALEHILSCDPEELCRGQRMSKSNERLAAGN